jgi:hypothetical protein
MKTSIDKQGFTEVKRKVRVESKNWIFDISECKVTGNLTINKVDGIDGDSSISVKPRYANEVDLK